MSAVLRIGLTGGIGSGKSTVCKLFSELGVPVIDADTIVRQLVRIGQPSLKAIKAAFGREVLTREGGLNRPVLRALVFNDPVARKKLEDILHPLVFKEIEREIENISYPYCIICIPLLIETKSKDKVDRILVVDSPEDLQIQRASKRDDLSREEIRKIMRAQTSRKDRVSAADDIIHNDGDLASLGEQIRKLHQQYQKASSGIMTGQHRATGN